MLTEAMLANMVYSGRLGTRNDHHNRGREEGRGRERKGGREGGREGERERERELETHIIHTYHLANAHEKTMSLDIPSNTKRTSWELL